MESRTRMNIGERTTARQPDACADDETWFISIYAGDTLFRLKPALVGNPVLSARDVSDADAIFVADPFMVNDGGAWYMFFEVLLAGSEKGEIGWAMSDDGLAWSYQQIVLKEPFHLSYPYVFSIGDEYYWWNREGMHHVDPHRVGDKWLACVDGWRFGAGEHEADGRQHGKTDKKRRKTV